jgi:hypothetical protein
MTYSPVIFMLSLVCITSAAPADKIPQPRPERCIPFDPDPEEGEMIAPAGLGYADVKTALNGVIQHALYCKRPEGMSSVNLTFDLIVGCNGVVSTIETVDDGTAPADYVTCVSNVVAKADFPAHDMADGMTVTYPVNVNW